MDIGYSFFFSFFYWPISCLLVFEIVCYLKDPWISPYQVLGIKWRMLYDCECYIVVRILLMIIKGQQRNLHDECLESSWNYDNEH
jgi:hypothetical protein